MSVVVFTCYWGGAPTVSAALGSYILENVNNIFFMNDVLFHPPVINQKVIFDPTHLICDLTAVASVLVPTVASLQTLVNYS